MTIAVLTAHRANARCCSASRSIAMSLMRPPIMRLAVPSRVLIQPLLQSRQTFLVVNFGPAQRFGGAVTVFQNSVGETGSAPTDFMTHSGHASSSVPARFGQK